MADSLGTLGSLVISLEGNIAKLQGDLTAAEVAMNQFSARVDSIAGGISNKVLGFGKAFVAAFAFDAVADGVSKFIEGAAQLNKLAQSAGVSVEALSGLKSVAKQSGTSIEEVATGLQKLSKEMYAASNGTGAQAEAFRKLGIPIKDASGALRDSGDVMVDAAKKIDGLSSGTERVAAAQMLFGKAGANLLPMLHDLAAQGELNGKVTATVAAQAEVYERNLRQLSAQINGFYMQVASAVLPTMSALVKVLNESDSATKQLTKTTKELNDDKSLSSWAELSGETFALMTDSLVSLISMLKVAGNEVGGFFRKAAASSLAAGDDSSNVTVAQLNTVSGKIAAINKEVADTNRNILNSNPTAYADAFLKALEQVKAAATNLNGKNGVITPTISDSKPALDQFDKFIQEVQRMTEKANTGQIGELRLKAVQIAGETKQNPAKADPAINAYQKAQETQFVRQYTDALQDQADAQAFALSLIGKTADEQRRLTIVRDADLTMQKALQVESKRLGAVTVETQDAIKTAAENSKNVALQTAAAVKTAYEKQSVEDFAKALQKQGDAQAFALSLVGKTAQEQMNLNIQNQQAVQLLVQIENETKRLGPLSAEAQAAMAAASKTATERMVADANAKYEADRRWSTGYKGALDSYINDSASAAQQSRTLFTNAFKGMEDSLVNFVKTGKLDFRSLADSIISDIIRIQIQNSITKPLASALGSGGGLLGSIGTAIGNMFGGGRAIGGTVDPSQMYVVGENGPEIFQPSSGGQIIPTGGTPSSSGAGDSGGAVTINFNVQAIDASTFRSTLAANKAVIVGVVRQAFQQRAILSPI